ncbi:MAG: outer membrane protein assembly factor BamA [Treponema sp.]|jgi:outer membrane protein insertion porin family|nr:outer membrane protein assembly factor BamA [Treponema sp.]
MRIGAIVVLWGILIFPGWSQESVEWYQGKPIKDIMFTGLKHVSAAELEGIVESYKGQLFTDDLFWELQGRLYALEYFELITPSAVPANSSGSELIIRLTVTERPIVSKIQFFGNNHLRRSELRETISLKVHEVVNQIKLQADERALINKYLEKGFPDIKVRSETQTDKDASLIVNFFIEEGERVALEALLFEGNGIFSTRTLRGQLSLKIKGLLNDGAFQEAKLIADRNTITQYYHDRGYIDAAVTDVVQTARKDEKGNTLMTITFSIYEGKIYTFGGVRFTGNQIMTTEQLADQISSKPGTVVNARRVEADLQRVADLYYENGYIFNTISREELRDTEKGVIIYQITIVEQGRAHIENILIKGNKKTKTQVILREIPLESGDVFSKTKVIEGVRNLYNLQYFSVVAPEPSPGSTDNLMDLVFTVEEQPTTDLQLGLTFSGTSDPDQFPVSLLFKWNDRNFLGYGNMVSAELNASPETQSIGLGYTHRWLFGLPLSGSFDLTTQHSRRRAAMDMMAPYFNGDETYAYPDGFTSYGEYSNASKIPPNEFLMYYDQWRISLGFSSGYRFSTFLGNLGIGGGVRTGFIFNSYDSQVYRPFDPTIRNRNNLWTPANSLSFSVSLDQRDIYYDPSKGYYGVQRLGYYGIFPVELEHYVKSDTKAEYFHTLLNLPVGETWAFKIVFGVHSGLSFIFPQPFRDDLPIETVNMLAVDGMFTGRGWSSEYYNKGLALWENWAELRLPLVPGILAWDLLFFDAAVVKETPWALFNRWMVEDMRFSLGSGLRFTIPQFPFRLSFAKRFKVVDGTPQWQEGGIGGLDFVISFVLSTY